MTVAMQPADLIRESERFSIESTWWLSRYQSHAQAPHLLVRC